MPDLRSQLREILRGRVCVVGVGNVEQGDDGLGVRLAERLKSEARGPGTEGGPGAGDRGPNEIRNPKSEIRGKLETLNPKPETACREPRRRSSSFGRGPALGPRPWALGIEVLVAGLSPDRYLPFLAGAGFDTVLFLDAVEVGAAPGSVVLLDSRDMVTRWPQVSTHRLSLGLLSRLIEAGGRARVWLLGVQPETLRPGAGLSPTVAAALGGLVTLLQEQPEGGLA